MNEALKKLLETADIKQKRAQEILGMGEGLTVELIAEAETLNKELGAIKAQAETLKGLGDNSADLKGLITTPTHNLPFTTGANVVGFEKVGEAQIENGKADHDNMTGMMGMKQFQHISTKEYKDAFEQYIRDDKSMTLTERKALAEGSDTAGGFLVPVETMAKLLVKDPAPTSLAANVSVLNCSRDSLNIPKVNYAAGGAVAAANSQYSSGMRVTWTGEQPAAATTARVTAPVFGQTSINIYTCMMSLLLTNDFIEDAVIDVTSWIRDKFSETVGLLDEDMIINGTGSNQPLGLVSSTYSTVDHEIFGKIRSTAIGASSAISALIETVPFKLAEQYHGNAKWCFNLASAGLKIFQLKDTDGRTLFGGGLYDMSTANGSWRQLLGFPVITSALTPNMGANAYPVYFGDFKGYTLVRRVGFSVQVLNETYAETNAKCLLGRYRIGGAPTEEWRLIAGQTPS